MIEQMKAAALSTLLKRSFERKKITPPHSTKTPAAIAKARNAYLTGSD